jgi:hypothetical protein
MVKVIQKSAEINQKKKKNKKKKKPTTKNVHFQHLWASCFGNIGLEFPK